MSHPVPFVKYADPAFTADRTRHCELRCLISHEELVLAVFDILAVQFRLIERYPLNNSYNKTKPSEILARIFLTHPLTRMEFKKIEIIPDHSCWQLVPADLFDENAIHHLLQLSHEVNPDDPQAYDRLADGKRILIYSWPQSWMQVVRAQFGDVRVKHHASLLFEILQRESLHGKKVFAYVHGFRVDILCTLDGNPLLFNTFGFHSPEDFIYFAGFAYERLNLNRETDPLILAGEVEEGSAIHQLCFKYFRNIQFFSRPGDTPVPDAPEDFPEISRHAYITLLHPYDSDY
jgi:hypothetical protein